MIYLRLCFSLAATNWKLTSAEIVKQLPGTQHVLEPSCFGTSIVYSHKDATNQSKQTHTLCIHVLEVKR